MYLYLFINSVCIKKLLNEQMCGIISLGVNMFKRIYVEITNNCNLNCSFCIGNNRTKKFIDMESFDILLDKVKGYTKYLYFHIMGEPLLHPKINELIDRASKDFFINITTNGYLIDRIKNNKNIRQINISLHSYDEVNGVSFEKYMNNIFDTVDNLIESDTIIKYRLWVNSKSSEDIIFALRNKYEIDFDGKENTKLANSIYFEVAKEFEWPSFDNEFYSERGTCLGCRSHIGVLVDGTVVPCCLDSAGVINLGNIYNSELSDIINGKLFTEIKNGFLVDKKVHGLCRKCNFYNRGD